MRASPQSFRLRPRSRLLAALCLSLLARTALSIEAGQQAPDFTLTGADGGPVQLAALRGKLVYLDFWASWCAPCRRSFPWMNTLQERYRADGLVVLGVNVDRRRPDADRFLAAVPARFLLAFDAAGASPASYAIKAMPSSVLIDPAGRVLRVHAGFRDEERDGLEARIRAALPARAQ